jgi:hypothetical protein
MSSPLVGVVAMMTGTTRSSSTRWSVAPDRSIAAVDVQELIDERDIVRVALRYCRALDTCDWPLLDTVFLADATARLGTSSEQAGREAIVGRCKAALEPLAVSQHIVSNHEVDVDGDEATHRCYMHAQHVTDTADSAKFVVAGRYEDRFVRTPDGWRITHRDLIPMWTDGDPAVTLGARSATNAEGAT